MSERELGQVRWQRGYTFLRVLRDYVPDVVPAVRAEDLAQALGSLLPRRRKTVPVVGGLLAVSDEVEDRRRHS